MTTTAPRATRPSPARNRLAVAGLLALAVVPILGGAMRLGDLSVVTPENARFVTDPVPIVIHVVSSTLYAVVGAFQFARDVRRRHVGWHRAAGTVLVPAGVLSAATGLWMTASYVMPPADQGSLTMIRYVVGVAMLAQLALAVRALTRHDFVAHGAWMTRAYALGIGAGTQVLTQGPLLALEEIPGWTRPVGMGLGWAINAVVAEIVIRRRARARR